MLAISPNSITLTGLNPTLSINAFKHLNCFKEVNLKQIFGNFEAGIERLDKQILSLQGNLARTLNSASNVDALQQIKQLGKEIDNLLSISQKLSEILSKELEKLELPKVRFMDFYKNQ